MLEKIGLPSKPSLRGNTWVVDASHCQGCSSQFSFINRKHHCRRCGGIFCGSCTQQRMVLRGQGDSPVRICPPCKKLEEAARFETRYGNKTRAAKGISKYGSKKEDEVLDQILGNQEKINPMQDASASCSNIQEVATQFDGGDIVRNLSLNQNTDILTEVPSATPEDLRQQSLAEKNKHRTLKAEGKNEEALKAFKRGKELERQAAALEISIRKNRKKALSSTNTEDTQESKDDSKASPDKIKLPKQKTKETNDLSSELKELGWSDLDIRDAEKKPATSVEGELFSLLREVSQKPNKEKRVGSSEKSSQVIAHKKKALELKRAGNLLEAKEELKRAKVLERIIEEEELLGGSDESDDELSLLIRDMDSDDKKGDIFAEYEPDLNIDLDHFSGIADHIAVDGNFEVTDEDMNDPEIASALQSFGWDEDTPDPEIAPFDRESSIAEIRSLKREALNQKRAGNTAEAMALLKKAKLLEKELEDSDTRGSDSMNMEPDIIKEVTGPKLAPKSKLVIQRELLALKKKALTLRREGKVDESEEELKKAKALEEQLEDMNKAAPSVTQPVVVNRHIYDNVNDTLGNGDEEGEEVTDQDLQDPAYASLLKNLGWDEEDKAEVPSTISKENNRPSKYTNASSITQSVINVEEATKSRKSKSEIQRELLQLKRKALTLRRQGEADEADEVLKMARLLEAQLEEYEKPSQAEDPPKNNQGNASIDALQNTESSSLEANPQVKDNVTLEKPNVTVHKNEKPFIQELQSSPATISSSLQQEILAHKRKAVAFKRDGKLAEAKEELRQAKHLEKSMENNNEPPTSTNSSDDIVTSVAKEASPSSVSKPLSSRDRFKLQQESLSHKRKALKLRREGKTAEADAEFELAKAIESQLQELDSSDSAGGGEPAGDVTVEDFLDPQLLSALRSVGMEDGQTKSSQVVVERPDLTKVNADANVEREQLMEQIKAEKVKALNSKRSGKSAEALDALRRAKLYEKKLQTLTSK